MNYHQAIELLRAALDAMLTQFTSTPSTLKDSDARCKAHDALMRTRSIDAPTSESVAAQCVGCEGKPTIENSPCAVCSRVAAQGVRAKTITDTDRTNHIMKNGTRSGTYQGITGVDIVVYVDDLAIGGFRYAIDCMIERAAARASAETPTNSGVA